MSDIPKTHEEWASLARRFRREGKHEVAQSITDDLAIPCDETGSILDKDGQWLPQPETTQRRQVRRGQEAMLAAWLVERGVLRRLPESPGELQRAINGGHPALDDLPDELFDMIVKT